MNLECDFTEALKAVEGRPKEETIKRSMQKIGILAESYAKEIINTFKKAKGTGQGVDRGSFRDGIRSEPIEDGFGFRVHDSVPYGIYHEFGTEKHWLPFFEEGGGQFTSLGDWAYRHFGEIGFEVIGKRGKALKAPARMQKIQVLEGIGGMMVSLDEMAPFRKSSEYANSIAAQVFREEMENE
jgi:hypothetical protein